MKCEKVSKSERDAKSLKIDGRYKADISASLKITEKAAIKPTKKACIDLDRSASEIVEEALRERLQNFEKNPNR
jgi:hypothetical protein